MFIGGVDKFCYKKTTGERKRKSGSSSQVIQIQAICDVSGNSTEQTSIFGSSDADVFKLEEINQSENVTKRVVRTKGAFSVVARTLDRYGISDRAGAAIVSATLQDISLINKEDC
nr:unnamed protein product [Callosobruchus analis]